MDNRPTREEAIKESLILWRELATNEDLYEDGCDLKSRVIRALIHDGLLPERAESYNSDCPLCAAVFHPFPDGGRHCERCPWPGSGRDRCVQRGGLYRAWEENRRPETARPVFELMKQLAKGEMAKEDHPTFKVGDRVKLVNLLDNDETPYREGDDNPLWDSRMGNVCGTVDRLDSDDYFTIHVKWDGVGRNCYNPRNLAHLSAADERINIVAGQLYRHEDQVLLAVDAGDDDAWFDFYTLAGRVVAGDPADSDVFTGPGGTEIHRSKLIPIGKSLQDLYDRAQ